MSSLRRRFPWLAAGVAAAAVSVAAARLPQPAPPAPTALAPSSPDPSSPDREVRVDGHVTAWRLAAQGHVYLRVETPQQRDDLPEVLWFRSPPDQASNTDFEEMLLALVVSEAERDEPRPLTVVGDANVHEDGESVEEAIPIRWVGR